MESAVKTPSASLEKKSRRKSEGFEGQEFIKPLALPATPAIRESSTNSKQKALADRHTQERHNFLITELVSSDGQLGPTLRAVYESERREEPKEFLSSLNEFVVKTDKDIERLCSRYYQSFITSIEKLLEVRKNAANLKESVHIMSNTVVSATKPLQSATERLILLRKTQRNILTTIDKLANILPVIQLYCKATSQLKEMKFYPALKSLDELETLYLTPDIKYSFVEKMRERVPQLRREVKQAAFNDLQSFLTDIRDRSTNIGKLAMDQNLLESEAQELEPGISVNDVCASDQVQFNLLHRSLHIYGVLGLRHEGELYYKNERKKQAALVLDPFVNMSKLSESEVYKDCFYQVAGFFIVEDTVLGTARQLLSKQWVDDLWDTAVINISHEMRQQLNACASAQRIRHVKEHIVHFGQTLHGYGYNCERVYQICAMAKDRYRNVLLKQCASRFKEIFLADNYTPCQALNEDEYTKITTLFPFRDRVLEEAPFPKVFPFSNVVPEVYQVILEFIDTSVNFIKDLNLSNTEIDESVRKSTNILLRQTLNGTLSEVINTKSLTLPQLTQISINTTSLQNSCINLENAISAITHSVGDDMHMHQLHGAHIFRDARTAVEQKLFAVLQDKMDDMLDELSTFDWAPAKSQETPDGEVECSQYVFNMFAFLTTLFAATGMPVEVKNIQYFQTCKYISTKFYNCLVNSEAEINVAGMTNFCEDIASAIDYATSDAEDPSDSSMNEEVFCKLQQIVQLFLDWDWSGYLDIETRKQKYSQVQPAIALRLLRRYTPHDDGGKGGLLRRKHSTGSKSADKKRVVKILETLVRPQEMTPTSTPVNTPMRAPSTKAAATPGRSLMDRFRKETSNSTPQPSQAPTPAPTPSTSNKKPPRRPPPPSK
eukprot:m.42503 g.42503  ORF g.42503 m.42503 type:complete len:889 (-) comp19135_c0_seq1:139-2805(-)